MLKIRISDYGEWSSTLGGLLVAVAIGIITSIIVYVFIVPRMRTVVSKEINQFKLENDNQERTVFVVGKTPGNFSF